MPQDYFSLVTNQGLIKEAASNEPGGTAINLTEMAVGDSNGVYYDPDGSETALTNEVYRVNLTHVVVDENNTNQLIVEAVLDETIGPFYIREVGIFDSNGDLFAIGKYPETFKPNLPDGSGKRLYIRMILGFANSPNVNLVINNDIALDPNFGTDVNNALAERLVKTNNLSDLDDIANARDNIEVYDKNYLNSKIGKNYIINGNFNIWQRGEVANNKTGYDYFAPDRFAFDIGDAIADISKQEFSTGQTEVDGNPRNFLRYDITTSGSGNSFLYHKIEDVSILSGKICTLSFYAKSDSPITLTTDFQQIFGSGGSATVDGSSKKVDHNITTSWQQFTVTFDFDSISGKILGSSSYLELRWYFNNSANVKIDFSQVQLEKGNVATDFEYRHIGQELSLCKRYYEIGLSGFSTVTYGSNVNFSYTFSVSKRVLPSMSVTKNNDTNINSLTAYGSDAHSFIISAVPEASGFLRHWSSPWVADSEL